MRNWLCLSLFILICNNINSYASQPLAGYFKVTTLMFEERKTKEFHFTNLGQLLLDFQKLPQNDKKLNRCTRNIITIELITSNKIEIKASCYQLKEKSGQAFHKFIKTLEKFTKQNPGTQPK